MTAAAEAPAQRRADIGDDTELAAAVLLYDGRRALWRDDRLLNDPDVTAWARDALDCRHPDYASLLWRELAVIRAVSHN